MPLYKRLAIIALAASSVSSALSAPTREVKERMDMVLLEPPTDFTLREVSTFPERSFGSSSKRATESRAIAGLDRRDKDEDDRHDRLPTGEIASVAFGGLPGLIIYKAVQQHKDDKDKQQRDVSPAQMITALNALDNRADVPPEDSATILRLLSRALEELD